MGCVRPLRHLYGYATVVVVVESIGALRESADHCGPECARVAVRAPRTATYLLSLGDPLPPAARLMYRRCPSDDRRVPGSACRDARHSPVCP